MQLSPTELREVQKKSIEIYLVFRDFCQKHNLTYWFCGGCCIGAVRHKGFVPWDDDIDIYMPRADFEKLAELWPQEMAGTKYSYCRSSEREFTRSLLASISDDSTTFIKERQKDLDIHHGVRLELFPLEGCPEGKWARRMQIAWGLLRQVYINQEPLTSGGRLPCAVSKLLLALCPGWKRRYKMARFAERRMSRLAFGETSKVVDLCARYEYMKINYPVADFAETAYLPFEDIEIPVPGNYDNFLTLSYGDYMQLPPEEQRQPPHDAAFVDLSQGYEAYKGIHYCCKND